MTAAEFAGRRVIAWKGEVSQADAWRGLVKAANAAFGRICILFDNAGISGALVPVDDGLLAH